MILFIAINQHRESVSRRRKMIINQCLIEMEKIDTLLLETAVVPHSKHMMLIFNRLKIKTLKTIMQNTNDPKFQTMLTHLEEQKIEIYKIEGNRLATEFSVPDNQGKALKLVKSIRRLEKMIKVDYSRGLLSHKEFTAELERLALMTFKINIDNGLARLRAMITMNQIEQSEKMLCLLSEYTKSNNHNYSMKAQSDLKDLYLELGDRKQSILDRRIKVPKNNERYSDIDLLFRNDKSLKLM